MRQRGVSSAYLYITAGFCAGALVAFAVYGIYQSGAWPEARLLFPDTAPAYLIETGDPYDLAITGPGFFAYETDEGSWVFSRESHFIIDDNYRLAHPVGYPLTPTVQLATDMISFRIDPTNRVWQTIASATSEQFAGLIELHRMPQHENYVWGGEQFWHGRPHGVSPVEANGLYGRSGNPILKQGWKLSGRIPEDAGIERLVNSLRHPGPSNPEAEPLVETGKASDFGIDGSGFAAVLLSVQTSSNGVEKDGLAGVGFTRHLSLIDSEPWPRRAFRVHQEISVNRVALTIQGVLQYSQRNTGNKPPLPQPQRVPVQVEGVLIAKEIELDALPMRNRGEFVVPDDLVKPSVGIPLFNETLFVQQRSDLEKRWYARKVVKEYREIQSIPLFSFAAPEHLEYVGEGIYLESVGSGRARLLGANERGTIRQGFLNQVERLNP